MNLKTTASLNQRTGSNTSYSVIATIPKGTVVKWYGYGFEENGVIWKLIEYNGKLGFCSGKYLAG